MEDVGRIDHPQGGSGDPRRRRGELDRRIAWLAQRQHGVVARDQLLGLDLGRRGIDHRIQGRRLRPIHLGVYAVGAEPLTQRGRWFAALLATRPNPLLSHLSAAAARGLAREATVVHITTSSRCPRDLAGVTIHRCRSLHPADVTRLDGLPVTTISRTLLDLAETLPPERFAAIVEEADRREMLDLNELQRTAERNPGRRGLKPFLSLIAHYIPTPDAEEGIERDFQLLLLEEELPLPEVNVLVAGHKVDCYWPSANFVVELDSRTHHSHWQARERDLVRDADLLRLGIPTMRVTSRRMREERSELVADLRARIS